jgi:hypothetical protein
MSLPTLGDGRQSGTSDSPSILNCSPESAAGGGLAWLRTGLFRRRAYWISIAICYGFMILVNGWLTKLSAPVLFRPHRRGNAALVDAVSRRARNTPDSPGLMMGETGVLLVSWRLAPTQEKEERLFQLDRFDDAATHFDQALAIQQALAVADPANVGWQRELSLSYQRLGEFAESAGEFDDARAWFDQAVVIRKALADADPCNTGLQRDLRTSVTRVADVVRSLSEARRQRVLPWWWACLVVVIVLAKMFNWCGR